MSTLPFGPSNSDWEQLGRQLAGASQPDHEPTAPAEDALPWPTDAFPGSPEKLDVLTARDDEARLLWHPYDADADDRNRLQRIAWRIELERNGRVGNQKLLLEIEAREPAMIRFLRERCDAVGTITEAQILARQCWGPDAWAVRHASGACRVGLLRFPPRVPGPAAACECRGEGPDWPAAFHAALAQHLPDCRRLAALEPAAPPQRGRPRKEVPAPALQAKEARRGTDAPGMEATGGTDAPSPTSPAPGRAA